MPRVTQDQYDKLLRRIAGEPEVPSGSSKRSWSNAQPTTIGEIKFPSKMEARVYTRLLAETQEPAVLFRQVRMPLLSVAPGKRGVPLYFTVDFAIVEPGKKTRFIDAKGKRVSREWARGKAAFEVLYGKVEEVTD